MIIRLKLDNPNLLEQVVALQKASYKVEADLIGFYEIPPLLDTKETLSCCNEIFYGYYIDQVLAGLLSYQYNDKLLDIHRLAIHPDYFRRGIAGKLLEYVLQLPMDIQRAVVCTGQKNLPAIKLYQKYGFHKLKDIEIADNIYLTEFERQF